MEVGNMIFGNSRGEYPVPRTDAFEDPWNQMCEALHINWRGYAEEGCLIPKMVGAAGVENHVFAIRGYDWDAECDCGADDKQEAWFRANPHGATCYQTELRARLDHWETTSGFRRLKDRALGQNDDVIFPGTTEIYHEHAIGLGIISVPRQDLAMKAYRDASDERRKFELTLYEDLCDRHGLDRHFGAAVHCTCGRDDAAQIYWEQIGGHKAACRFIQPNFLFKPTDFHLSWYKYPFRDAYMSAKLGPAQWRKMLSVCIESASANQYG